MEKKRETNDDPYNLQNFHVKKKIKNQRETIRFHINSYKAIKRW